MRLTREGASLADVLDARAVEYEMAARTADGGLPFPDVLGASPLQRFGRSQWRDAGIASTLREVAAALRAAELPLLRVRTWLLAWQIECDRIAEEAMSRLATVAPGPDREAAVARSAFVLGRAKGARVASELCQPQPGAVR